MGVRTHFLGFNSARQVEHSTIFWDWGVPSSSELMDDGWLVRLQLQWKKNGFSPQSPSLKIVLLKLHRFQVKSVEGILLYRMYRHETQWKHTMIIIFNFVPKVSVVSMDLMVLFFKMVLINSSQGYDNKTQKESSLLFRMP